MSLKITQKGGTQVTAPQKNAAVFTEMQYSSPTKNAFNLSKQTHGTMEFGKLYPVYSRQVYSGDNFKIKASHFIRFAAVLSPLLNKINISYTAFYVPYRLVWKFWPTFISGGYNNDGVYTDGSGNYLDASDKFTNVPFTPQIPRINLLQRSSVATPGKKYVFKPYHGTLLDWLHYPTFDSETELDKILAGNVSSDFATSMQVTALPLMCYQKIIDDWFVNPNIKDPSRTHARLPISASGLQTSRDTDINSDISGLTELAYINYGLDYFTSCLPYLQRGEPLMLNGTNNQVTYTADKVLGRYDGSYLRDANGDPYASSDNTPNNSWLSVGDGSPYVGGLVFRNKDNTAEAVGLDNSANLSVQLGTTIQELRYVNALQEFAEKSLRVGTRYIDFLKAYFDVNSSDRSLQRSQFLGSFTSEVNKTDIEQTSMTDYTKEDATPLGTITTKLTGVAQTNSFGCYCEENGIIMVLACVTPQTIYKNRMNTEYLFKDKEDFLFPEFTHLSPQAVQMQELFVPSNSKELLGAAYDPTQVFGYQDRYNEMRCDVDDVHGDFKGNLSFFLQMRSFDRMPSLNTDFLRTDDIDTSVFATSEVRDSSGTGYLVNHIWASFNFDVKATRCLPKIATPSLV